MSVFSGTREWIYAKRVGGRFQKLHRLSGIALIGALFIGPWIRVGGHPAILADVPARRAYLLGYVFTASDGFLMVLGALMAAFGLFLASALLGRLWCGYLCPQTVFLEEWVRRVEHWFEGDASARRRRDAGPWTLDRIARKTGKVLTLWGLALALGMTVISYFGEARLMWTGQGSSSAYMMVGIISSAAMADWLWFREQLCIYLCPYARFQSVLTDDYSLTVSFDSSVPILPGRAGVESGCIDCKKCVTVCPQGIDIRDGFQLECINCARCVDACTDVMGKLDRPSLVNYTTIALQEGRPQKTVRPRVVAYAALITGIAAVLVGTLVLHNPIEVTLNRAPGMLYQLGDDNVVRNTFLLRVVNNDGNQARDFDLSVDGLVGAVINTPALHLGPEEGRTVPVVISAPRQGTAATVPLTVTLAGGEKPVILKTTFKAPGDT